ncbi:hypothetical protein [Plantactinospora sp. KLBMP9567]|uniref:hypothetical protein n=1 Tax=Plantactinospora sp. KLBMP9567 TaxID=3085900 RepID=UPI002981B06D|nr:hypothetical protein [Plantactinospora sp. KLBMP9567]MDW5329547.1 hypothetical protein [Plantactinospora sp. KLBMP9567]
MSDVRVSGVVMAHPDRTGPGQALIRLFRPGFLDLVLDPQPDGPPTALRTAMRAWSSIPAGATHHLVLEDDAEPSPGFAEHAERAAAAMPDVAIAFHSNWSSRNGGAVRLGLLAGARWARAAGEYTPTVALMLPAAVGAGFAAYAAAHGDTWPGDVVMARYLSAVGVPTYLTVPNLVEHGDLPSLTDNDQHGSRRAACFGTLPADADWGPHRVLEPDVVPFFKFGMALCAVREGPTGRWLTLGFDRSSRRLGIDAEACLDEFRSALKAIPDAVRGLGELAPPVLESLWRAAYLTGFAGRRPERPADLTAELAAWSADPWVDEALTTLGRGGLCTSFPARRLLALGDHLREVARAGLVAGARHRESAARRGPAGPRRRVAVIAAKGQALGRCVAADLGDRGYDVATVDLDGPTVPEDELRLVLPGATALVYAGTGAPDDVLPGLVDRARSAGVPRIVHLDPPPGVPTPPPPTVNLFQPEPRDAHAPRPTMRSVGPQGEVEKGSVDGLAVTTLRLGVPYGPEIDAAPVNDLVARALRKKPLAVDAGRRDRLRFVHVWDVGAAVDRVLRATRPGATWDVCGAESVTPYELATLVSRVVKPVPVEAAPDAPHGRPPCRDLSADRTRSELGWAPTVALAEGVRTLAQWLAYEAD